MLAKISSRQLSEWMAFERLEPFEGWRGDFRNAISTSQLINAILGIMGSNKKTQASDYMPDFTKAFLEEEPKKSGAGKKVSDMFSFVAPRGSIKVWQGMAPAIKRIGKRGKSTPRKRKLQEILHGKSR